MEKNVEVIGEVATEEIAERMIEAFGSSRPEVVCQYSGVLDERGLLKRGHRPLDRLNEVVNLMTGDNINFIDLEWRSYRDLKKLPELLHQQVRSLYGSGLCEPNDGIEFTFVPTKRMMETEERLKALYDSIRVCDTKTALCNEVFYTSKIEGANTTIKRTQQIHDGEFINLDNAFSEYMIKSGFEATKYMNLISNRVDEKTIRKCWEILTDGCIINKDIMGTQYRTDSVQVGPHVGLNHVLLDEMMTSWINFYNGSELESHPFIKAAFLHYTFEHIHPFCDGNGRMGRLLMNNFLIKEGYEKIKAVSFSRSIEKDRAYYDTAFTMSDNVYSDCTFFIQYMLDIMEDAFSDCLE